MLLKNARNATIWHYHKTLQFLHSLVPLFSTLNHKCSQKMDWKVSHGTQINSKTQSKKHNTELVENIFCTFIAIWLSKSSPSMYVSISFNQTLNVKHLKIITWLRNSSCCSPFGEIHLHRDCTCSATFMHLYLYQLYVKCASRPDIAHLLLPSFALAGCLITLSLRGRVICCGNMGN